MREKVAAWLRVVTPNAGLPAHALRVPASSQVKVANETLCCAASSLQETDPYAEAGTSRTRLRRQLNGAGDPTRLKTRTHGAENGRSLNED